MRRNCSSRTRGGGSWGVSLGLSAPKSSNGPLWPNFYVQNCVPEKFIRVVHLALRNALRMAVTVFGVVQIGLFAVSSATTYRVSNASIPWIYSRLPDASQVPHVQA